MLENSQQNITQNIGSNTGATQAIAAGRDAYATQQTTQDVLAVEISQEQAIELLTKIEELIRAADLPKEIVEEAADYTSLARKEAKKKEPRRLLVVGNLEAATSMLQKLGKTVDTAKELISKLKPLLVKLASWLGVAANHFFG